MMVISRRLVYRLAVTGMETKTREKQVHRGPAARRIKKRSGCKLCALVLVVG